MPSCVFMESGGQATHGLEFYSSSAGAATVDGTVTRNGPKSIKLNTSSPAVDARVTRTGVLADAGRRISFWFRFSAAPAASSAFCRALNSGGTARVRIRLTTSRTLSVEGVGASTVTGSTVLSVDTWYRITFSYSITSTTIYTAKVYINGTLEATANTGTLTGTGTVDIDWQADTTNGTNRLMYFSDIYIDDGTDSSDPGKIGVTYKAPNANTNINEFDTGVGASPANRWENVDDRPISAATGWQQAASAEAEEVYTLQNRITGDLDIGRYPIVAVCGWVWAKQTTGGGGSPAIFVSSTGYSITLTSTAALHTKLLTQDTYPNSDDPTPYGIGMRSGGTADDTFLYECGCLIAYEEKILPLFDGLSTLQAVKRAASF